MITKQALVEGIRFAGERAAAAAEHCADWDHQLGHQWTTRDAFVHVAASAGGAERLYPMLDAGMLSNIPVAQVAQLNAQTISGLAEKSKDEVIGMIRDGHEASAKFVDGLAEDDLAKVITLGGYTMPKAEIVAQIWIHHAMAHAYEASARWPIL